MSPNSDIAKILFFVGLICMTITIILTNTGDAVIEEDDIVNIIESPNVTEQAETFETQVIIQNNQNLGEDRCQFLRQLVVTDYTINCTDELEGRIYYNQKVINVGDINNSDINMLTLILFHEIGHSLYGADEDLAKDYSIKMMNDPYYKNMMESYAKQELS